MDTVSPFFFFAGLEDPGAAIGEAEGTARVFWPESIGTDIRLDRDRDLDRDLDRALLSSEPLPLPTPVLWPPSPADGRDRQSIAARAPLLCRGAGEVGEDAFKDRARVIRFSRRVGGERGWRMVMGAAEALLSPCPSLLVLLLLLFLLPELARAWASCLRFSRRWNSSSVREYACRCPKEH